MSDENHIATAADIRELAATVAYEAPERIVLPKSGFALVIRRPTPIAYALSGVPLPQGLAARIQAAADPERVPLTDAERAALMHRHARVFVSCFVQPKFSLDPGPDEVSPNWLPEEDQNFLVRYLGGEIDASGADLATFRSGKTRRADSRANGGDVEVPPERVA